MSGGVGPFEGMQEEKTGEITVYCGAESHELWERTYSRRGDIFWMPDSFEYVGGERGEIRRPRRGGGIEFIDAAGRVLRSWDSGVCQSTIHWEGSSGSSPMLTGRVR